MRELHRSEPSGRTAMGYTTLLGTSGNQRKPNWRGGSV
jgi:hypothetical protein